MTRLQAQQAQHPHSTTHCACAFPACLGCSPHGACVVAVPFKNLQCRLTNMDDK